ncbi:hypothetical protein EYF80_029331 [Liparis tanakae]|uniref:Uncharacterized protein n=1 Tax=Liparis tanakae TaxID=230148 RepID=A0A4Z2H4T5_9TELE|nr:hypothetical protein EYF80_029331 [Liparis tanakae]
MISCSPQTIQAQPLSFTFTEMWSSTRGTGDVTVECLAHLADSPVLRGEENSRLVAAPETLLLPVVRPCCRRPELGVARGVNMSAAEPACCSTGEK